MVDCYIAVMEGQPENHCRRRTAFAAFLFNSGASAQAAVSGSAEAGIRPCRFGRELHASSTTFPLLRRASM